MLRSATAVLTLCLVTVIAQASLLGRAPLTANGTDYQAYYDDILNITWLADANYAQTSGYDSDGWMTWNQQQIWIASLNSSHYLGTSEWRLPKTTPLNGLSFVYSPFTYDGATDLGYNISAPGTLYAGSTASEMAHLFYVTLGNTGLYNTSGFQNPCAFVRPIFCLTNAGPFSNIQNDYWTGTQFPDILADKWAFFFDLGYQPHLSAGSNIGAWAVHDGDPFAVVPIPPAAVDDGPIAVIEVVAQALPVGVNDTGFTNPVTVAVTTQPAKGTITAISPPGPAAGMTVTYTANVGAVGDDSFVYEMTDSSPAADSATVTLRISQDTDGDGVVNETDNCTLAANADQRDTNGDGYGNICDPDFNNNGIVDSQDGAILKATFGSGAFPDFDLNGNGIVDSNDGARLKARFGKAPGPSGLRP